MSFWLCTINGNDYIVDEEEFENNFKGKIWNWHESKFSDIKNSVEKNKMVPYTKTDFLLQRRRQRLWKYASNHSTKQFPFRYMQVLIKSNE
jgi:hypothetical protein